MKENLFIFYLFHEKNINKQQKCFKHFKINFKNNNPVLSNNLNVNIKNEVFYKLNYKFCNLTFFFFQHNTKK